MVHKAPRNIKKMERDRDIGGLISLLEHPDVSLRRNAAEALERIDSRRKIAIDSSELKKIENAALNDTDSFVQEAAAEVLNRNPKIIIKPESGDSSKKQDDIITERADDSGNNKIILGLAAFIILLFIGGALALSSGDDSSTSSAPTSTASTPAPTSVSDSSSNTVVSAEDEYKQWLKQDYQSFTSITDSSAMYSRYLEVKSKVPPAKYNQFHQHYVKDYYYWYKALEASERGDMSNYDYYYGLAQKEESKLTDYMPDYLQVISSS